MIEIDGSCTLLGVFNSSDGSLNQKCLCIHDLHPPTTTILKKFYFVSHPLRIFPLPLFFRIQGSSLAYRLFRAANTHSSITWSLSIIDLPQEILIRA